MPHAIKNADFNMTQLDEHRHYRGLYYQFLITNKYRQIEVLCDYTSYKSVESVWAGLQKWSDDEIKEKGYNFVVDRLEIDYFDAVHKFVSAPLLK